MSSRFTSALLCAAATLGMAMSADALPIEDPLDDPFENVVFDLTGAISINSSREAWTYDAQSQVLFYYYADSLNRLGDNDNFSGLLTWQARVDSRGNLLDSGSMTLLGNLAGPTRLLATATMRDIGFHKGTPSGCSIEEPCYMESFRVIFDAIFLDAAVASLGQTFGLWFETSFYTPTDSPFANSFSCGFPGDAPCHPFSTSGLTSIASVPEPSTSGLLAIGLLLVGFLRTGRRILQPVKAGHADGAFREEHAANERKHSKNAQLEGSP